MSLLVVDHRDPEWQSRYRRVRRQLPENGAHTYSAEIVKFHVPAWREEFDRIGIERALVGSCGPLDSAYAARGVRGDVAVQYIHRAPYAHPQELAQRVHRELAGRFGRVVFVTAHVTIAHALQAQGLEALHVPMTVDAAKVRRAAPKAVETAARSAVWLGNLTKARRSSYQLVSQALRAAGWSLTTISASQVNGFGPTLPQEKLWRIAAGHELGIGVARSALELMALGMPVLVAGAYGVGGIVTSDAEWEIQTGANFGGLVVTYSREVATCLGGLGRAIRGRTNDVALAAAAIRGALG